MGGRGIVEGEELRRLASQVPDWRVGDGRQLSKTFLFPDFKTALAFVNRVADVAERQGHHPDLHLAGGRVDVTTSTHDAGGLTACDFALAAEIDRAYFSR
jgi:4a-hydroxytetrahydrobiopterin dehydratase